MQPIAFQFLRINSIMILAALVTFLLFYFMQYLIATGDAIEQRVTVIEIVDSYVPEFDPPKIIVVEEPEPIVTPPTTTLPPVESNAPVGPITYIPEFVADEAPSSPGLNIPITDNIMVPLVRTTPTYPQRALSRGLEGFVELSFTVNPQGYVEDPMVLHAEPEGIFERAALNSIRRWRYAPAVKNGEPVPTHDVRQRIVFQMDASR